MRNALRTFGCWRDIVESLADTSTRAHVANYSGDDEWYTPRDYPEAGPAEVAVSPRSAAASLIACSAS